MTSKKTQQASKAMPLDRRHITRMALALIDGEGFEQFSMRKLGTALGVEGMALYHYFKSKAELLDGVLDLLLEDAAARLSRTGDPLPRIRETFDALRAIAIAHPNVFPSMVLRRFRTDTALQFYENLLALFRAAGLNGEQSARYYRMMANFTVGAGVADVGSRALHPDASPIILEAFERPDTFPFITEAMPYLRADQLDRIYVMGMDILHQAMERECVVQRIK